MKFENFLDKALEEMTAKENYDSQIYTKCTELQQTRDDMAAALKAGKMTLFTELTKKSTAQEAALKQLTENQPKLMNTAKGIITAWNKHIETHNKEFSEKLDAFHAARHALCALYMELIEMQRTALVMRDQTSKIVGMYDTSNPGLASPRLPSGEYVNPEKAYSSFGLDAPATLEKSNMEMPVKFNGMLTPPEVAYFISRCDLPEQMFLGLVKVQERREVCSKADLENAGRYRTLFV